MNAKSSIHICAAKSSAEIHNERRKDMAHIRKEFTHLNEKWVNPAYEGKSMSEIRKDIEDRYKLHTHQTMQKKARPLREAVVNIKKDTTLDDLLKLAENLQNRFGIKTIAIYTHREEGHEEEGEWITNHHAHMEFDWTDDTGRSLKLNQHDMANMQTIVAETLGMERGKSSDIEHLNAIQYKVKMQTEQNVKLQQDAAGLQQQIAELQEENEVLRQDRDSLNDELQNLHSQVEDLRKQVKRMNITKKGKEAMLEKLNAFTSAFGKSKVQKNLDTTKEQLRTAKEDVATLQAKVDKIQTRLDRQTKENDATLQQLYASEQAIAEKDAEIARLSETIYKQSNQIRILNDDLRTARHEKRELERSLNPRMYALPDVVDLNTFCIINLPGPGNRIQISVNIEGYRIKPKAIITQEDNRAYFEDRLSKQELVAKYFSLQIEATLLRRLRRMKGNGYMTELKKIENTMFFRMPSLLHLPCALNIPGGSSFSENPNVRHKSKEEIERELIDQGYSVRRGYGMT